MKLTAEQIQDNWEEFCGNIKDYITGERKEKLLEFYQKYEDRIMMMLIKNIYLHFNQNKNHVLPFLISSTRRI